MTSATLAVAVAPDQPKAPITPRQSAAAALLRPAGRRGEGQLVQAGSPFDYERQMKIFVAAKMPDPREPPTNPA
jgi:Rad3-related DNA helicase